MRRLEFIVFGVFVAAAIGFSAYIMLKRGEEKFENGPSKVAQSIPKNSPIPKKVCEEIKELFIRAPKFRGTLIDYMCTCLCYGMVCEFVEPEGEPPYFECSAPTKIDGAPK